MIDDVHYSYGPVFVVEGDMSYDGLQYSYGFVFVVEGDR